MKKDYFFTIITSLFLICNVSAQGTEDFESPLSPGATSFTNNGQIFNILSTAPERFDVFSQGYNQNPTGNSDSCVGCGWNGTAADDQFIDSSRNSNGDNNGSTFSMTTGLGNNITIKSLYMYCATSGFVKPVTGTLTITGLVDGNTTPVFTFTLLPADLNDPNNFALNNGFTEINFSNINGTDYSELNVDEITFVASNDMDYIALDAFTWGAEVLSTNDFQLETKPKLFPNPSSDSISVSNLKTAQDYNIIDILGKTIDNGIIAVNESIDISKLKTGTYFLKLNSPEVIRFIKK
ncbi:T9SS type A sorting domain-containing protein [Winogradskyella jejuensis]|uniref:Por secretion system C-terminal sorting domain-containing protein n=1 Tax=Winogradskyella jejuensis TaxID=1089305 RepID=A0A1M5SJ62_9FLAO|nr:T9SS type A sorting domain-containing protein [Winogradskyella jejuensis]SHH37943.1 Por secretion system C-terminal sorting domain-containing protein [Winogradskyella jejuensis]